MGHGCKLVVGFAPLASTPFPPSLLVIEAPDLVSWGKECEPGDNKAPVIYCFRSSLRQSRPSALHVFEVGLLTALTPLDLSRLEFDADAGIIPIDVLQTKDLPLHLHLPTIVIIFPFHVPQSRSKPPTHLPNPVLVTDRCPLQIIGVIHPSRLTIEHDPPSPAFGE